MNLKTAQKLDAESVFQTYRRLPLLIVRAKGNYIYDDTGRKYLDLISGLGVNSLGHSNPKVVAAIRRQTGELMHVSNLYLTEPMLGVAARLKKHSGMDKVFFCNSGAEANEAAYKLARKYSRDKYGAGRYEIISFHRSFHGRTLANIAATGQKVYQKGFEPMPSGFRFAEFNNLASIEKAVGKKTCAILVEPIQGEGGVYPASPAFLKGLDALRKEKDILLIFDEVQCGLGRSGKWFAFQRIGGARPDILTVAKAIGGGLPMGAMLARKPAAAAFAAGNHASTFGANPVAAAAALAVMDELESGLIDNAAALGAWTLGELNALKKRLPIITGVRGLGLMIAVEIKGDAAKAAAAMLQKGILVNAIHGTTIRILPPFTVTRAELDRFIKTLEEHLANES